MSPSLHACPYCGCLCTGETCRKCADLPALDRAPRETFDADALALERYADALLEQAAAEWAS